MYSTVYTLQYATNKTYEFIGYYGDEAKDEADIIKKTVDAIQENVRYNFEFCIRGFCHPIANCKVPLYHILP